MDRTDREEWKKVDFDGSPGRSGEVPQDGGQPEGGGAGEGQADSASVMSETGGYAAEESAAGRSDAPGSGLNDGIQEAKVDYSIAAGTKEDVRSSFAWNSGGRSSYSSMGRADGGRADAVGAGRENPGAGRADGKGEGIFGGSAGIGADAGSRAEGGPQGSYYGAPGYGSQGGAGGSGNAAGPGDASFSGAYGESGSEGSSFSGAYGEGGSAGGGWNTPPGGPGQAAVKKQRKPLSAGSKKIIAAVLAVVIAFAAGLGGGATALALLGNESGGAVSNSKISIDSSESGMDAASVIAEKVMPSVVGISTVSKTYVQTIFGLQQGTTEGSGTGFIVDENGYILTNAHVVDSDGSSQITVDLYDGSEYEGEVLWSDSSLDLAIVKIDAKNLQAVDLGDSDSVKIGDYALAIGNPLGRDFERSVTQGIISGLDRSITTTDSSGQNANEMQGLIQTDASINSGNSGGPLINSSGEVIAINTAKASSAEGLGFAIPINTALPIIEEIKTNGTYEQPYLGITGLDVEEVLAKYETDFNAEKGVYVYQIYTDSPAAAAGMKEGDIITAIDGEEVDDMNALKQRLISYKPGDQVTLTVERQKQEISVTATLATQNTASTMQYKESEDSGSGNSYSGGQDYGSIYGGLFGN